MLGLTPEGDKLKLLTAMKEYVPETFALSMFKVKDDKYTDKKISKIVDKLLAVPPSRRQPEAAS